MSARTIPMAPPGTGSIPRRGFSPWRDLPTVLWLVLTVAAAIGGPVLGEQRWLVIHLLLLGAVTHAIMVWSQHFADAILRTPLTAQVRSRRTVRLALLTVGTAGVLVGVCATVWPLTLVAASVVVFAVLWHGTELTRQLRRALPTRFTVAIDYYIASALCLPVGVTLGVLLARGPASPTHERLLFAHTAANLLGWVGLTVVGTVLTLWPSMLRTKMAEDAEKRTRQGLPVLVAAVVVVVVAAVLGLRWGVVIGIAGYLAGLVVIAIPLVRTAVRKHPLSFPTWSVGAALVWLSGCLVAAAVGVALAPDWVGVGAVWTTLTPYLAAGFAGQVLLGALSYLLPVTLGGGPSPVRAANRVLDTAGAARVLVVNAGLALAVLPVPATVRTALWLVAGLALGTTVPLLVLAVRASRVAKRAVAEDLGEFAHGRPMPRTEADPGRPGRLSGLVMAGTGVVVAAVVIGASFDPVPVPGGTDVVTVTGETTIVQVEMRDMRYYPERIEVPAGNRLVIDLSNTDGMVHDLVLATGQRTGRLSPGESVRLDAGTPGADTDGWCSVTGHRGMGMTLDIVVTGAEPTEHLADGPAHGSDPTGSDPTAPDATLDPHATPSAGFVARDASLPPLDGDGPTVREVTLTVTEQETEVAPGVTQRLWTFGGSAPGPVLHGRVGDVFEITLVNDGSIGHSIDFHAGALAPDEPMRTIAPGEELVYRFTATRSGIWMYHCSTMPMSAHIANGMFGAVVIEPPDLAPVDRSYVVVQSELYFGPQGGTVDVDKVAAERPDAVVFNGYANQYDHEPLEARVGERVRVWVLAAGPNRGTSFHVVGAQFDTVYAEGVLLLSPGGTGGSQALGLTAAQGGYVELTFPEPGNYPFVNHSMVDAERGAHGLVHVTP